MFYEDQNDIFVARFGLGDILVMGSHLDGSPEIGSISLIDNCGKCLPIGKMLNEEEWAKLRRNYRTDDKLNTVIRLVFEKTESIDVLIDALICVKEEMLKAKPRSTQKEE